MRIDFWNSSFWGSAPQPASAPQVVEEKQQAVGAYYETPLYGKRVFTVPYDGENNLGDAGPLYNNVPQHEALRLRAWDMLLKSEVGSIGIRRLARWVIGNGLKLQAEPQVDVLKSEKIDLKPEEFNKIVEARFRIFANSKSADFSNQRNLHVMANEAYINTMMSDVLVILRYVDNSVKVQLIDGCHVQTPYNLAYNGVDRVAENGNRVRNGIEIDASGQHVAYYVFTGVFGEYKRVEVYGKKSKMQMAFLINGLKFRLDNMRTIPRITASIETIKKLDRYAAATLGSAEERVKIPFIITHGKESTGENPMAASAARAYDYNPTADTKLPKTIEGQNLANQVAATEGKTVYNMPVDSDMKSIASDNEVAFKDFHGTLADIIFANIDVPPNVAMSKYDSNFSASRAALKDWEHTLSVERKYFADQFYLPIYRFWLETQILTNKIQAPGYLNALAEKNTMAVEAYLFARFVGANVPHIDPEKEVRALRLVLGKLFDNVPLGTAEAAAEMLNQGDFDANLEQVKRELDKAKANGIELAPPTPANANNGENADKEEEEKEEEETEEK